MNEKLNEKKLVYYEFIPQHAKYGNVVIAAFVKSQIPALREFLRDKPRSYETAALHWLIGTDREYDDNSRSVNAARSLGLGDGHISEALTDWSKQFFADARNAREDMYVLERLERINRYSQEEEELNKGS